MAYHPGGIANTVAGQRRTLTVFPCIALRRYLVKRIAVFLSIGNATSDN